MALRDSGCRFPGCTQTLFIDCHHIRHWAHGGRTDLANLIMLCSGHHRAVHEEGFGLRVDRHGSAVFTRPDGQVLPPRPVDLTGDPAHLSQAHEAGITPTTVRPAWCGERLDLDLTIWALFGNEKLARQRAGSNPSRGDGDSAEAHPPAPTGSPGTGPLPPPRPTRTHYPMLN